MNNRGIPFITYLPIYLVPNAKMCRWIRFHCAECHEFMRDELVARCPDVLHPMYEPGSTVESGQDLCRECAMGTPPSEYNKPETKPESKTS